MRRVLILLVGVFLFWTGIAAGQTVLAGFVRADSTERPIPGVEVLIEGSDRQTTTDARGKFVLSGLPIGTRVALFRSIGWRSVRLRVHLAEGDTVWTEATMIREAVRLAPVEVTAELKKPEGAREGLEDRRRMGFGRFMDSTVIRASEHLRLSDLLRRIDGITLARRGSSIFAMSIRRQGCFMQVILDGRVVYRSFAPTSQDTVGHSPPDLARDFDLASLDAIEVYRSAAETPGEFSGAGAACGTIVLWTRRG